MLALHNYVSILFCIIFVLNESFEPFDLATVIVRGLPSSASWQDLKVGDIACFLV